ncbi:MAG: histidine kinase [Pseudomonadota bacterium]|nr:histidine kinase [Pseudomonadota bacterium]
MVRFLAGAAACFLLMTGAFLLWQSRAAGSLGLPSAPEARLAQAAGINLKRIPGAPSADPKDKEQKRFDRADKNKDGSVTLAELVEPRRKPYAKLDLNHDGHLSFEEWAVKTITKFKSADADHNDALTRAEYAATAPKPKAPTAACACD